MECEEFHEGGGRWKLVWYCGGSGAVRTADVSGPIWSDLWPSAGCRGETQDM